jgi:AraC-like DNA-binding protein
MIKPYTSENSAHSSASPHHERVVLSSGWQEMAAYLGGNVDDLLTTAELPAHYALDEFATMTMAEFIRLWAAMEKLAGGERIIDLLLPIISMKRPAPYLAALCCDDFRSAISRLSAMKRPVGPLEFRIEENGEHARIVYDWSVSQSLFSPLFVLLEFAVLKVLGEYGLGREPHFLRYESPLAHDIDAALAKRHLGQEVEVGPEMVIVVPAQELDQPFQSSNPVTLKILDEHFRQLEQSHLTGWAQRVSDALKRLLPQGQVDVERVARALHCSVRTLQRELAAEATSFRDVMQQTRHDLACRYMRDYRYSPAETAGLLGYSEPTVFYRAFRSWTGKTPKAFMEEHPPAQTAGRS